MRHIKELLIALAYSALGSMVYTLLSLGFHSDVADHPLQQLVVMAFVVAAIVGFIVFLIKDIRRNSDYPTLERVVIILLTGFGVFSLFVELWLVLMLHINQWLM